MVSHILMYKTLESNLCEFTLEFDTLVFARVGLFIGLLQFLVQALDDLLRLTGLHSAPAQLIWINDYII